MRGRVQGVSFRWHTVEEAERLDLKGWVKNHADGSVILEVQGEDPAVEKLLAWCKKGPPAAKVTSVEREDVPLVNGERGFDIR